MSGPSFGSGDTFVVRYRYDEGILLDGNTRPHKDAIKKAWPRWRWFRSLGQWGVQRTRNTVRSKSKVQSYADGLTKAGLPNVEVDYEAPALEDLRDFGEKVAEQNERSLDRADHLEAKGDRLDDEASSQFDTSRGAIAGIPPGQPILVGHHSERRHRRDLARSDRAMGKSVQASRDAKHARNRAAGARDRVAATQTPSFAIRRIREATQQLRELEVKLTGKAPAGWRGFVPSGPASGPWKDQLLLAQAEQQSKLRHYRDGLSQTYVPLTTEMRDRGWVRKGDWLMSDRGKIPLIQVANKTAIVGHPKFRQRMNLDRLWVPRSTLEERGFTDPAAAATSPETETVPMAPAPPKPTAPPTPKPAAKDPEHIELFARSFQITPGDQWPRTGSIEKALAEAERQGFADLMFGWLRENEFERPALLTTAYGRARGTVALEQNRWPPPPIQGTTYGHEYFLGVIGSLQSHPVIAELSKLTRFWGQRMEQIGGGPRDAPYGRDHARRGLHVVTDELERQRRLLESGSTPTPALAKSAGDTVIAEASRVLAHLKVLHDPALYNGSIPVEEVQRRLCDIDPQVAIEVLRNSHDVEFSNEEPLDVQAHKLCDGSITLDDLRQTVAREAEQRRASDATRQQQRLQDAAELLKVRTAALARGPMTVRRFNNAYRTLWPNTAEEQRKRRRLKITPGPSGRATVLGPSGHSFVGPDLDTNDRERIEGLFRAIEQELHEAQCQPTTPRPAQPEPPKQERPQPPSKPSEPRRVASSQAATTPPKTATTAKTTGSTAPTKPKDIEAFARSFQIQPDKRWPPPRSVENALAEAERQGFADQVFRWLRAHNVQRPDLLADAYGEARGIVALERGSWPPRPIRGSTYGRDHYVGILNSLRTHPLVVELSDTARYWGNRMEKIGGGPRGIPYGRDQARHGGAVVSDVLASQRLKLERGTKPTHALAKSAGDTAIAEASRIRAQLNVLLDPALYDGSIPVEEVQRRLCDIDFQVAKEVLRSSHGVEFSNEEPLDVQAHRLCDGDITLDDLRETVAQEAEQRRASEAKRQQQRRQDATELLKVRTAALARGPMTVRRFNNAYRTLWPKLTDEQRKRNRLRISNERSPRAIVRGPAGHGFFGPRLDTNDQERIEGLFKVIEHDAGTPRRDSAQSASKQPQPKPTDEPSGPSPTQVVSPPEASNGPQYPAGPIANEARPSPDDDPAAWTAKRATEARHLLRVRDDARNRGPLTARRFNIAYNRAFPKAGSDERRLVLSVDAPPRQAFVRGPNHAQFNGPEVDGSFQEAMDGLMKVLERAAAAAPPTPATPIAQSTSGTPTNDEPRARLEYVDVATGAPAAPDTPGTLSTGRVVTDIDGETVEVDPEDLVGRGDSDDPRTRTYPFDKESPLDYPGQARAQKQARTQKEKPKRSLATPRKTFDTAKGAARLFYDNNASFFDHVRDPWDGLRDWMDGIEVKSGKRHKKLALTPAGKRIVSERHAAQAIRHALAYIFGQAKGRRWETVPWAQIDRLESSLAPYFEAPTEGGQPGLTWRPFTGTLRVEDLDAMSPEQREAARVQESVREIGEQLQQLRSQYNKLKECLPTELRQVVERRIAEWSRWLDDPSQIPDYACEPDPKSMGYLCNYPAIAGELAQLRRSCTDAYDPAWAARDSKAATPGFPDTSGGEDEAGEARKASVAPCCGTPATPDDAKTNESRTTVPKKKAPKRKTKQSKTKPSTAKASKAQRNKDAKQRREWTAARRRADKLQCSADAAKTQAKTIDLGTYEKRVKAAAADEKAANKVLTAADREHAATKRSLAKLRSSKASSKELRAARAKVTNARCAARVAKSTLTQRTRDHRRAQTELRHAKARVAKRQAVADKRQRNAMRADKHAKALRPKSTAS